MAHQRPVLLDLHVLVADHIGQLCAAEDMGDAAGAVGKQKVAEMRNYEVPEQYQIAAESEVRTKGRYVYLVISQAAEDAEEIIEEELERP